LEAIILALRLKKVIESRGIPLKSYSALLGISERTLYNKLAGSTEFTVGEFQRLKIIFPEYDVLYLMSEENVNDIVQSGATQPRA